MPNVQQPVGDRPCNLFKSRVCDLGHRGYVIPFHVGINTIKFLNLLLMLRNWELSKCGKEEVSVEFAPL